MPDRSSARHRRSVPARASADRHWRVATLIAADAAFGLGDEPLDDAPEPRRISNPARRAAARFPERRVRRRRVAAPARRPPTEYRRLAREILTSPEWRAAVELPERRRQRVLSQLMDAALAARPAEAGVGTRVQQ